MESKMQPDDPELAMLQKAMDSVSEHFDTIQIFATRQDQDGTFHHECGTGNWFARRGQIRDWLTKSDEVAKQEVRRREDGPTFQ